MMDKGMNYFQLVHNRQPLLSDFNNIGCNASHHLKWQVARCRAIEEGLFFQKCVKLFENFVDCICLRKLDKTQPSIEGSWRMAAGPVSKSEWIILATL